MDVALKWKSLNSWILLCFESLVHRLFFFTSGCLKAIVFQRVAALIINRLFFHRLANTHKKKKIVRESFLKTQPHVAWQKNRFNCYFISSVEGSEYNKWASFNWVLNMPVGQIVKSAISFGVSKMPVLDKIRSTSFSGFENLQLRKWIEMYF